MDQLQHILDSIAFVVWGPVTVGIFALIGLFLTLKLRLLHVRNFRFALQAAFGRQPRESGDGGSGDISRFQALMVVLAGAIGNGNIAGVATAIVSGGPGALFWMWVMGLLNMATKYSEGILGFKYRRQLPNGEWAGGPMYYLRYGLNSKSLAVFFAFVGGLQAMSTGPLAQTNSMALVVHNQFSGISLWVCGIVIFVAVFIVVIGGIKTIARFAEKLTPLKVLLFVGGAVYVLAAHGSMLPAAFGLIFASAFHPQAAIGGIAGAAVANQLSQINAVSGMRFGAARGLYATEAGLGTAAIGYAVAKGRNPVQQALLGVLDVFVITFITCTMSGLVVMVFIIGGGASQIWHAGGNQLTSTALVAASFKTSLPTIGGYIVMVCSLLFGYTNLISWGWYGEKCFEYLAGTKIIIPYRIIYCLIILLGPIAPVDVVWAYADILNAFQALPNVIGLLLLSGTVLAVTKEYLPGLKNPASLVANSAAD